MLDALSARRVASAFMLVSAVALGACGSSDRESGDSKTSSSTTATSAAGVEALTVGIPTLTSGSQIWVAQATGAFTKAGVKVTTKTVTPTTAISGVLSGQTDITVFPPAAVALPGAQGKPLSIVYTLYSHDVSAVMAGRKDVTSPEALAKVKNCKIATLVAGTEAYYQAQQYAKKFNSSCKTLPLATPDAMVAAVARGDAAAAVASYGSVAPVVAAGNGHIIIDTRIPAIRDKYLGGASDEPDSVLLGAKSNLSRKGAAVAKFLKGMDDAYTYMQTHSNQEIADTIAKVPDLKSVDGKVVRTLVDGAKPYLATDRGYLTRDLWQESLPHMAGWGVPGFSPTMKSAQYDNIVDMSYYEKGIGKPSGS